MAKHLQDTLSIKPAPRYSELSVSWQDSDGNRYHIWIENTGHYTWDDDQQKGFVGPDVVFKDTIYKNPPLNQDGSAKKYTDEGYFDTRYLKSSAKANDKIMQAIREFATPQRIECAYHDHDANEQREAERKLQNQEDQIRAGLLRWINETGFPQPGVNDLSRDQLFALRQAVTNQ